MTGGNAAMPSINRSRPTEIIKAGVDVPTKAGGTDVDKNMVDKTKNSLDNTREKDSKVSELARAVDLTTRKVRRD